MNKKHWRRSILPVVLLGTAVACPSWAGEETEPNDPIERPQSLPVKAEPTEIGASGQLQAIMGQVSGAAVLDTDFFAFSGEEGDVVTLDIDGGMGGARSVDTIMAVFGPGPAYELLRYNDDVGYPVDPGSTHPYDSRIEKFRLPTKGQYIVGVSSYPRMLRSGGTTTSTSLGWFSNGDYTLIVSGLSLAVQQINIDIKPGEKDGSAPVNPKARGKIPVALLGASDFNTADVDRTSLTFGHTGNEASLHKCGEQSDVNFDGQLDLVCHFQNQLAEFHETDDEAVLKGRLRDGQAFEGRGWLKMVPVKAQRE